MWIKVAGLTAPLIGLGVIVGLAFHGSAQAQTSPSDADCVRSVAAAHTTLAQAEESGAGVTQAATALAAIQRECSTAMGLTAMTTLSVAEGAAASPSPSPAPASTASSVPAPSPSATSAPASTTTATPSPSASASTSTSPTSCSVQQSASSTTVDHTAAANAALNVAAHHTMLANSALSDGQLAHITCQQQQAQADYRAAATAAPVWDVVDWINSNPRGGSDSNAVRAD